MLVKTFVVFFIVGAYIGYTYCKILDAERDL